MDLDLEASTVTLKRPTSEGAISSDYNDEVIEHKKVSVRAQEVNSKDSDDLLNDILQVQETKNRNGWHNIQNLKSGSNELYAFNTLSLV